ncbi:MAG: DnaJ domain-containing protein [Egibacteraceae bacterium]
MTAAHARWLLGLRPEATPKDVDRAFRRLARVHHPDRGGDASRFAELVVARAALQRSVARRDRQLIVCHATRWRRAARVVGRWRFRARQQRATARVR